MLRWRTTGVGVGTGVETARIDGRLGQLVLALALKWLGMALVFRRLVVVFRRIATGAGAGAETDRGWDWCRDGWGC